MAPLGPRPVFRHSRACARRWWPAVALLAAAASSAHADRLLVLRTQARTLGKVRIAEILAGSQVLIRLRSQDSSPLPRAERAADALRQALLAQWARPKLSQAAAGKGQVTVRAGATTIVTADAETAKLSSTTPDALAAGWLQAIRKALTEPYLVLSGDTSVLVPVGESRSLRFGGPLGRALTGESGAQEVVRLTVAREQREILVTGVAPGIAAGALHAGRRAIPLSLEARKWAAVIPTVVTGTLTGTVRDDDLARKMAINAALCATTPEPGAQVAVASVDGQDSTYAVTLAATGQGYLEARRNVAVTVRRAAPPTAQPVDVWVSNTPERISSRGCLLREQLDAARPVRLLYHHLNSSEAPLTFVLRIANPGREPASVHVALGEAGPSQDELATGHAAARRFWEEVLSGSGCVLQVPPGGAWAVANQLVPPNGIVSGLGTLTLLSGGPLYAEICSEPPESAGEWLAREWRAGESPRLSNFRFPARKVVEAEYEVGGKWAFVSIGREGSVGASGARLAGDYGVLQEIHLGLMNPTPDARQVELIVRASGGLMRGLFLIDDELHETGALQGSQEETLARWPLAAGTGRIIHLRTVPESASNYPITLIVRAVE